MEQSLNNIIAAILSGEDYRPFVLDTINRRFVENVHAILLKIFDARQRNSQSNWWQDELITSHQKKEELLWFAGLNNKTVFSMAGSTTKEICLQLGIRNLKSLQNTLAEFTDANVPHIKIRILHQGQEVRLSEDESLFLMNAIATMKLTVQGGAWSEVGKKVEKRLLFTLFEMLSIPSERYVLVFPEMKRRGLVESRQIDAIVFTDDLRQSLRIELKLLGGNPEVGDEAIARGVDLYLVDRSSNMMIENGLKHGVTTIELRNKNALRELYSFFCNRGITCCLPATRNIREEVAAIGRRYDEKREKDRVLQAAKRLIGAS